MYVEFNEGVYNNDDDEMGGWMDGWISSPYSVSLLSLTYSNNVSKQTVLQAITASESHLTKSCLDASQGVQCEGESAR